MAEALMFKFGEEMVSKLVSLAADEFTLAWNFQSDLKNLQISLEMVNDLIRNTSSKNNAQLVAVQSWLKDLNTVAFDADVVLEDFAYETLRYKVENRKRDKVLALISPSKNQFLFRQKLAHKIQKVKASVSEIFDRGTTIGLIRQLAGSDDIAKTAFYNDRLTHSFIEDDSEIVGRDTDVLKVVKMLCDDDHDLDLSVIAIKGLGGQGKTTLAQLVFKNEKVVKHFDNLIWVCVSEEFVLTTLLNQIVQSCTKENPQLSNLQAIIEKLQEKLKNRRYLLVLDVVWNKDEHKWNNFRSALLGISGAKGSKVMVTTRDHEVASTMQASSHPLDKLSDDESWTMFKQRAFARGGAPETEAFKTIGKEIVKRCFGLPLAIKVIASLMYSKKSKNEWLSIQDNQLWNIADNTDRVVQTLKLSYDHLPFQLKRCFCFCSIYPKDKVIEKDELIQCWMALGLLQVSSGCDQVMEDVGEKYFQTLLSMCLFQDIVKDEFGLIESCKMHDIVHDLALMTTTTDYSTLKSVALVSSDHVNPRSPLSPKDFSTLRILVLNKSIKGYSINKLKHLRYLDIRGTSIKDLPSSFTTCYNLQTLKFSYLHSVSKNIAKLINLRHLCVESMFESGNCWLNGIGRLTSLQTLPLFGVNREHGCHITELESLNNLTGDLTIFGLDDVLNYEEAKLAFLSKKQNLCMLRLCWGQPWSLDSEYSYTYKDGDNSESVLEGLEPHTNLKCLKIENFKGGNFPQWMMAETHVLGNLVNLELIKCDKCERIPPLGHLQCLKVVKIISLSNAREIGLDFYGSSIVSEGMSLFPVLRELSLQEMPKLERWLEAVPESSVSKSTAFTCLEKLLIKGCPNLKSFPSHFPSLTDLRISNIDSLALNKLSKMQSSLTTLRLASCGGSEFQSLLEDFLTRNSASLIHLLVVDCDEFVYLPDNLMALNYLYISKCENLTDIQHCLPSARTVHISYCSKLIGLPSLSQVFPVMEYFSLKECNEIVALPDIGSHTCLQQVEIRYMAKITSVPELCESLRGLTLHECNALVSFPDFRYLRELSLTYRFRPTEEERGPSHFSLPFSSEVQYCLERLEFGGLPELKSLPDQIQHLTALTELYLHDLDGLESLPNWLGNIISLKTLHIWYCKKLKYFPSAKAMRRLVNLSELDIYDCPLLEERISKGTRPEWRNISHIPRIIINDKAISKFIYNFCF